MIAALAFSLPVAAKNPSGGTTAANSLPEAQTFVWRIERSGQPVSYLVGTLHMGRQGAALKPDYARLLKNVAQLYTESDAGADKPLSQMSAQERRGLQAAQALMAADKPLRASLGMRRLNALNARLQECQEPRQLDPQSRIKPWVAWLMLESLCAPKGYSYTTGVDRLLTEAAVRAHLPVKFLEDPGALAMFDRLPIMRVWQMLDVETAHFDAIQRKSVQTWQQYQNNDAKSLMKDFFDEDRALFFNAATGPALLAAVFGERSGRVAQPALAARHLDRVAAPPNPLCRRRRASFRSRRPD